MSEIERIGMYSTDEILEFMTDGEGRGFLGRSMFDAMYFKIEELENQLQQKENIIKEVREYVEKNTEEKKSWLNGIPDYRVFKGDTKELLEILDKGE